MVRQGVSAISENPLFLYPYVVLRLFLSEEDLYRTAQEVELRTQLVFKEAAVWFADILREVAEERE